VAIYDAVYAAGMTFPFPQRDVHLISPPSSTEKVSSGDPFPISKKSERASARLFAVAKL
jgi:hypothetical protein